MLDKELESLANCMNKISSSFGMSAYDAAEAIARMIDAIENSREEVCEHSSHKFRVKSEEVEIDWIS